MVHLVSHDSCVEHEVKYNRSNGGCVSSTALQTDLIRRWCTATNKLDSLKQLPTHTFFSSWSLLVNSIKNTAHSLDSGHVYNMVVTCIHPWRWGQTYVSSDRKYVSNLTIAQWFQWTFRLNTSNFCWISTKIGWHMSGLQRCVPKGFLWIVSKFQF